MVGANFRWRIELADGDTAITNINDNELYSRLVLDKLEPEVANGLYLCEISSFDGSNDDKAAAGGSSDLSPSGNHLLSVSSDKLYRYFGLHIQGK